MMAFRPLFLNSLQSHSDNTEQMGHYSLLGPESPQKGAQQNLWDGQGRTKQLGQKWHPSNTSSQRPQLSNHQAQQ